MTNFVFSVLDGCANSSTIYNVEAETQESAEAIFVRFALPIAYKGFTYNDFVVMMKENDVIIQSLGENPPVVKVPTNE